MALSARQIKVVRLVVLVAAGASMLTMMAWVLYFARVGPGLQCPTTSDGQPVRPADLLSVLGVGACIAGFFGGHLFGRMSEASPDRRSHRRATNWQRLLIQVGLAVLVVAAALTLAYETIAVLPSSAIWPVTYYVRCGVDLSPPLAVIGGLSLSFLLGHWFWYPDR